MIYVERRAGRGSQPGVDFTVDRETTNIKLVAR
jgi:hypothetical protein